MDNEVVDVIPIEVDEEMFNIADITRFEVIDDTGRRVVEMGVHVSLDIQDDGRTMKIFLTARS